MKNILFLLLILSITGFGQNTAEQITAADGYSNWLFIDSDKAVQVRYKLVKQENEIGYFNIQFRINFEDEIYCSYPECEGYLMAFGIPTLDRSSLYKHYKIYNTYKDIYTMPEEIPIKLEFPDGSKRMLRKYGFYYTYSNSNEEIPADYLFYACVDNILSNDPKHRCRQEFIDAEALILK